MNGSNAPINGEVKRWGAILALVKDIWNTFGLPTILLALAIGLWIGWIPSPLSEAQDDMKSIKWTLKKHAAIDNEQTFYLRKTCLALAKLAKVDPEGCIYHEPK